MQPRIVEIRQGVLDKNDQIAARLRAHFHTAGILAVNMVSSPGTGKTALLEEIMRRMGEAHRVAALVGDLATENDAIRLRRSGAAVRQIETGTMCHLEANLVERYLVDWDLENLDFLFIENVGNLVCPSDYDLGEDLRVVLLSVTEGEDKPLKYPPLFSSADLAVITKIDLAEAVDFERVAMHANLQAVRPGIPVIETSARSGAGIAELIEFLLEQRRKIAVPRHE